MATKNVKYAALVLDNLAGGLADTGNPTVINKEQSPCLFNVEFSRFGSVSSRTMGDRLIGTKDDYGEVLALRKICLFDSCDWLREPDKLTGTVSVTRGSKNMVGVATSFLLELKPGDQIRIGTNNANTYIVESITDALNLVMTGTFINDSLTGQDLYLIPPLPSPAHVDIFVRGVADPSTGNTLMQYLDPNSIWTTFDTIEGQHQFDIETFGGDIYYSNGIEDLRMTTICATDDDDPCSNITFDPKYPTCSALYTDTKQVTTLISTVTKSISFAQGKAGPDLHDVRAYFVANPAANLTVSVPDLNSSSGDVGTFVVTGVTVENSIIYYTSVVGADPVLEGTYYDGVELTYGGAGSPWYPTYCLPYEVRLAEGVKGYMLKVYDGRLFISGNLDDPDMIAYSKKAAQFSRETFTTYSIGDFDIVGISRTVADSERVNFTRSCAMVTAMAVQGGQLYIHRETDVSTEIYTMQLVSTSNTDGYFRPVPVINAGAASWFRNISVINDYQWYITTFYGIPENKQFGLFPNMTTVASLDRSQNIRKTMSKMDFSHGAVAYFDRKIFYAGRYIPDSEEKITIDVDCIATEAYRDGPNDTLLVYDLDAQAFSIYKGFYVNVFYVSRNRLYYGSSIDSNVWEMALDQLVDKLDAGDFKDVYTFFSLKRFHFNSPGIAKQLFRVYIDGYIAPGTTLEFGIVFDCNTSKKITISYDDIKKSPDCFGLECVGIDCEGCHGRYNSIHFQKHIELNPPAQFSSMQPYFRSDKGFWQVDAISFFVNQLPDDDINSLANCGINAGGDNCMI